MHDATEAYCQDIPAPLKRLLPDYKRMEEKIDAVIREKYGLPPVMSTPVKYADLIMLATERRDLGLDDGSFMACTGRYPGNRDVQSYSTGTGPCLRDVYGTLQRVI